MNVDEAKAKLDLIIRKARVDLYKPIQVAEVLQRARISQDIDITNLANYRSQSKSWRDNVTRKLLNKVSTSSARFQDNLWDENAIPPEALKILNEENLRTNGGVEKYIYLNFKARHGTVGLIFQYLDTHGPKEFKLSSLLQLFINSPGIRRSIDKAFEIVTYALLETVIVSLEATITVEVQNNKKDILDEFQDLSKLLLGVDANNLKFSSKAHLYRVGVTNAADRGLDMWGNFGPAVQVKHLTINPEGANMIVDQVESDMILIVCKKAEKKVIETVTDQIGWGRRVRGIVTEADLERWYELCLTGKFSSMLGENLLSLLLEGFKAEFPHNNVIDPFMDERGYMGIADEAPWVID